MTPPIPPAVVDLLRDGDVRASMSVGLAALGVLLIALVAKVVLQTATPVPHRAALRLLDIVALPLLVVFLAVVVERFSDLS